MMVGGLAYMRLKILDRKPNEITLEIEGERHTFCNLLESVLLEDEDVEFASYNIAHPLISHPIMRVRTNGNKSPEEALKAAIKKIIERGRELRSEFEKALKAAPT